MKEKNYKGAMEYGGSGPRMVQSKLRYGTIGGVTKP